MFLLTGCTHVNWSNFEGLICQHRWTIFDLFAEHQNNCWKNKVEDSLKKLVARYLETMDKIGEMHSMWILKFWHKKNKKIENCLFIEWKRMKIYLPCTNLHPLWRTWLKSIHPKFEPIWAVLRFMTPVFSISIFFWKHI